MALYCYSNVCNEFHSQLHFDGLWLNYNVPSSCMQPVQAIMLIKLSNASDAALVLWLDKQ